MARTVTTNGQTQGTIDQALHNLLVTFEGTLHDDAGATEHGNLASFQWGLSGSYTDSGPYNYVTGETGFKNYSGDLNYFYAPGGNYTQMSVQAKLQCDRTYQMRAVTYFGDAPAQNKYGVKITFKNDAVTATSSVPTSSGVTSVSATIACNYFPNTSESTCTVKLQYKRSVDPTWIDAGAADTGITGYNQHSISRGISGLLPVTQYDVRLVITRTTNNATTHTSSTSQFTTTAAAPTITTNPATNLTSTTARLNGTVNPNGASTTYWFDYGIGDFGSSTAAQGPNSGSVPVDYFADIGPLTPNAIYQFRAHALQGGVDYYGATLFFSTDTQGHIMPSVYQLYAKYGVATDFFFCVETKAATGSDRFLNAAVPWIAGDAKVDKDGAGLNNVSALPVRVGVSPLYKWSATGPELTANKANMLLVDQDGPEWRDLHLAIETRLLLGQIDVDATAIGGNIHAMSLVGVGTGYGLFTKGSSGLFAQAQGTSGHGIAGSAVGAGVGISGLGGVGPTNIFDTFEGAELVPGNLSNNMTMRQISQLLKRRFSNKTSQDSSQQKWYRDDSVALLATRTVSDDLVTQVQNKLF